MDDILNDILRAADRHPNSRVSKLIRLVEEEPSQKNVVLLLIELSEHAEYATDFNISLRYYLDIFERLGIDRDLILNEAGLLLVNSSKIYAKRVDYVQSLVERQIMTLSNADNEVQQQKEQNQQESSGETTTSTEKPKRGRKRVLDAPTDPYEVQLEPKKFKKITQEKRFSLLKASTKSKTVFRNVEVEQQIHPAGWKYATIYDLENEEDVDTKRNYKLFTYHIEHRYNTLVPDINFRLHFKVKDYMDAQEEEMDADGGANQTNHVWPAHSEEYVRKYISLENRVLQQEIDPTIPYVSPKRNKKTPKLTDFNENANMDETMTLETSVHNLGSTYNNVTSAESIEANETTLGISVQNFNTTGVNESLGINDSGIGTSDLESTFDISSEIDNTQQEITTLSEDKSLANTTASADVELGKSLNSSHTQPETDSAQIYTMQQENAILSEDKLLLSATALAKEQMDKSLNGSQMDSALGESILDHTNYSNYTTTELNVTSSTEGIVNSTLTSNSTIDQTTNDNKDSETDGKGRTAVSDMKPSEDNVSAESENICINSNKNVENAKGHHADIISENLENNAISNEVFDTVLQCSVLTNSENFKGNENISEAGEISKPAVDNQKHGEVKELHIISIEKNNTEEQNSNEHSCTENETVHPVPNTEELQKSLSEHKSVAIDQTDTFQVEIEVVNEDGKAESNTIQIQIPNYTDDEGVHLSDAYEDDFQLISPTLKIPNIMPGIERKDVTIYLDKELREALELRDNMVDHFSQETYKVPVITEPKEQPLIFNILQLPPKIIKRKTLFKLGPDMDLYLKARMLKSTRTKTTSTVKQLKFFALNSTDMSGILETPPHSPGNASDFLGFTDDDDNETTCAEFCGFTEDEQNKLLFHRLSRDSGVGVDVATLTPEKEPLEIIFEENDTASCAKDLGKELADSENLKSGNAKESTEDILKNLPTSIRTVLEVEMEENVAVPDATPKLDENEMDGKLTEQNPVTAHEAENIRDNDVYTEPQTSDENEKDSTSDHQIEEENIQILPEEYIKESVGEVQQSVKDHNTNDDKEYTEAKIDSAQLSYNNCSVVNQVCEVSKENVVEEQSENPPEANPNGEDELDNSTQNIEDINIDLDNDGDSQSSQQDNSFFDLDIQGAKTKIQQWHEQLRPILAKSRERHHFDVFQLGTEIIETIQSEENVEQTNPIVASFGDIMHNKDKSYVSRYFLSTLLLANQSNINISVGNKSSEIPSSWSDIKLELISTKRHTVAIEDNIGMISNRKRKNTKPIEEDMVKKKKSTAIHRVDDDDECSSTDDSEPLVNLQTIIKKTKITPTKRPVNCENLNIAAEKRFIPGDPCSSHQNNNSAKSNKVLITSQILLPSIHVAQMMPSTSKAVIPNPANYEVNLNNIRILQPIEKLARQGDDLDSGIFSVGEMSTS